MIATRVSSVATGFRTVSPGVHVTAGELDELTGYRPHASDLVSVARQGFPSQRTAQYLAARTLLRQLLTEVTGGGTADLTIAARPSGQPFLPEAPGISVSLSHDGPFVAAAVGVGTAVGVDVQQPEPVTEAVLRRCCAPGDLAALTALPDVERERAFAWIWTAQEACVKAAGTGFSGRPWTVAVAAGARHGHWRGYRWCRVPSLLGVPVSCAFDGHRATESISTPVLPASGRETR